MPSHTKAERKNTAAKKLQDKMVADKKSRDEAKGKNIEAKKLQNKMVADRESRDKKAGRTTKPQSRPPIINLGGGGIENNKQGAVSKALDIISAPLSQPGATLSGGLKAGAAAVKESRGKIAGGDTAEQAKVALKTFYTTAILAAPFTVGISAPIIKIAIGASGVSGMMTWLASDNVISGASIFTRDLTQGVRFGTIDPTDALAAIAETETTIDAAVNFLNFQTSINPALWPFSKIINLNAKEAKRTFNFNRDFIIEAERGNQDGRQE